MLICPKIYIQEYTNTCYRNEASVPQFDRKVRINLALCKPLRHFGILISGRIASRIFNVETSGQSHVPADVIRSERVSVMHFNGRQVGHQSLPARFVEDIRLLLLLGIE